MLVIILQVLLNFLLLEIQPIISVPFLITIPLPTIHNFTESSNHKNNINKTNIKTEKTGHLLSEATLLGFEISKNTEINNKKLNRTKREINNKQNRNLFWAKISKEKYNNKQLQTFINISDDKQTKNVMGMMQRRDLTNNYKRSYEEIQYSEKQHFITKRDTSKIEVENEQTKEDNILLSLLPKDKQRNDNKMGDDDTPLNLQPDALLNKHNTADDKDDSGELFDTAETHHFGKKGGRWGGGSGRGGFGVGWGFSGGGSGWGSSGGGCVKCVKQIPVVIAVKPILIKPRRRVCGHPKHCNYCGKK